VLAWAADGLGVVAAAMLAAEIPKSAIALRREKNILISHILLHESNYHVLP
jgi:hypothetical protein